MIKKFSWVLVFLLFAAPAFAAVKEAHPRIWLTDTHLAELRARAAANSDEWVALKTWCDAHLDDEGYDEGDANWIGYLGSAYNGYITSFALAYQILKVSDPVTAATYATYALQIMDGIATGFAVGDEPAYGLAATRIGTSVDGTTNIDEAIALDMYNRGYKQGYPLRNFGPAVAIGYDWLHDELSAEQKTLFSGMLYRWIDWFRGARTDYNNGVVVGATRYFEDNDGEDGENENSNIKGDGDGLAYPNIINNYVTGYAVTLALAAYATYGDNDDDETYLAVWEDFFNNELKADYQDELKLKGGDPPEGWQYKCGHTRLIDALLGMYTASDTSPFTDFDIAKDFFFAWIHAIKPNLTYIYDHGDWPAGTNRPYQSSVVVFRKLFSDVYPEEDYAEYAQYYMDNVNFISPTSYWRLMLWYDSTAPATPPTAEPLYYRAIGTGLVIMRSSWTDAIDTIWASIQLDNKLRVSHENYEEGHFTIQRGDDYLICNGAYSGTNGHNSILFGGGGQRTGLGEEIAISSIENTDDYLWVTADIATAYQREWYNDRATKFIRKFVWIKPSIFVIFDDTTAGVGYEDKQWMIHFRGEPTLANDIMISTVGVSKVFAKTLTPTDYSIEMAFHDDWRGKGWRVDIAPTTVQLDDTFLHAIYVTDSATETMPSTIKITSDSGGMVGVHIKDDTNQLVLFKETPGTVSLPVEYTITPTATCEHFLFDIPASTRFSVSTAAGSTVVTVTEDVGGGYTSSSEGVLTFETEFEEAELLAVSTLREGKIYNAIIYGDQ